MWTVGCNTLEEEKKKQTKQSMIIMWSKAELQFKGEKWDYPER
jgi:hypothetical protein